MATLMTYSNQLSDRCKFDNCVNDQNDIQREQVALGAPSTRGGSVRLRGMLRKSIHYERRIGSGSFLNGAVITDGVERSTLFQIMHSEARNDDDECDKINMIDPSSPRSTFTCNSACYSSLQNKCRRAFSTIGTAHNCRTAGTQDYISYCEGNNCVSDKEDEESRPKLIEEKPNKKLQTETVDLRSRSSVSCTTTCTPICFNMTMDDNPFGIIDQETFYNKLHTDGNCKSKQEIQTDADIDDKVSLLYNGSISDDDCNKEDDSTTESISVVSSISDESARPNNPIPHVPLKNQFPPTEINIRRVGSSIPILDNSSMIMPWHTSWIQQQKLEALQINQEELLQPRLSNKKKSNMKTSTMEVSSSPALLISSSEYGARLSNQYNGTPLVEVTDNVAQYDQIAETSRSIFLSPSDSPIEHKTKYVKCTYLTLKHNDDVVFRPSSQHTDKFDLQTSQVPVKSRKVRSSTIGNFSLDQTVGRRNILSVNQRSRTLPALTPGSKQRQFKRHSIVRMMSPSIKSDVSIGRRNQHGRSSFTSSSCTDTVGNDPLLQNTAYRKRESTSIYSFGSIVGQSSYVSSTAPRNPQLIVSASNDDKTSTKEENLVVDQIAEEAVKRVHSKNNFFYDYWKFSKKSHAIALTPAAGCLT